MSSKIISTIISVVATILFDLAIWFFGDVSREFKIIITLSLVIIVLLALVVYLIWQHSINKKGEKSDKTDEVKFSEKECNYSKKIKQAKKCIFFSGSGMAFMNNYNIPKKLSSVNSEVDCCIPVSYFAVDYRENSEKSFIQVKHYLLNPDSKQTKVYYCTVRPGHPLYDYHKEQILILEELEKHTMTLEQFKEKYEIN